MTGRTHEFRERPEVIKSRSSIVKDALPFLITFVAGLICYGLFYRRGLGLSVIGYSLSPAERVMHGEVPYRDSLFNYTPGILLANALLMKLFGATLIATRIGILVFKLLTLMALYYVARRLTSGWGALVPVVLTLAWLGHGQIFNAYPDQYLVLFVLFSLAFMLDYDKTGSKLWLLFCGAAAGCVFLFKYNVGLLVFAAGALALLIREVMTPGRSLPSRGICTIAKRFALLSLGFAIVAGALVVYLVWNDAFGAMLEHFSHHAAEYSETRSVGLPPLAHLNAGALALLVTVAGGALIFRGAPKFLAAYLIGIFAMGSLALLVPGRAHSVKESAIAAVAYFPPFLFAAALLIAMLQLRGRFHNGDERLLWWRRHGAVAITGLFALGLYLEVFPRADYHHLVRVLPLVFVFLFLFIVRSLPSAKSFLGSRLSAPDSASLLLAGAPLGFLLIAGLLDAWWPQFDGRLRFKDRTELTFERGRGILAERRQAELAEGLVRLIQDNSSFDDHIFSFSQRGSSLYFLAERRNPTRLLWWSSVGIKGEEREAVMSLIADRQPKLIIIQDIPANRGLQDHVSANYHRVGVVADIEVYDRNP